MDFESIDQVVRGLHKDIWLNRTRLGIGACCAPIFMIEPENAAKILGLNISYYEELGGFEQRGVRYETAGIVDRCSGGIALSNKFPLEVVRFTGAHEIGHWMLHPDETMHRDRPVKGLSDETSRRSRKEREADYFAASFLIPEKLLRNIFFSTFMTRLPFEFDDASSFWLCPEDPDSLLRPHSYLDRALALASAEAYQGRHFFSLAKQFRVSAMTMAIRLRELKLIAE